MSYSVIVPPATCVVVEGSKTTEYVAVDRRLTGSINPVAVDMTVVCRAVPNGSYRYTLTLEKTGVTPETFMETRCPSVPSNTRSAILLIATERVAGVPKESVPVVSRAVAGYGGGAT